MMSAVQMAVCFEKSAELAEWARHYEMCLCGIGDGDGDGDGDGGG